MAKRIRVVLIAVLSALMLLSAGLIVGNNLKAKADDLTPILTNYAKNLSFNDSVYVKYAISTENVQTSDELGMLVWTEAPEKYEIGTQKAVLKPNYQKVNGTEMPVFRYPLAAKQMTDTLYTVAYAKRGETYYYSAPRKYSVIEYAYNKLGKTEATPTTNQNLITLLNGMLVYGGAAQTYFEYNTDRLASEPHAYVKLSNATFSDGYDYIIGKVGSKVEITLNEGYELSTTHADYITVEGEKIYLTIPNEKTIDSTSFAEEYYSKGLLYEISTDGTYYILAGIGECTDTDIVIPDTYEGLPVKEIKDSAFSSCSSLTSVVIGDSAESIGNWAFYDCSSLTSVVIGDSVESIGDYAFYDCSSLTSVTFGKDSKLVEVEGDAFSSCSKLKYNEYGSGKYLASEDNEYFLLYELTNKNLSTCNIHEDTEIIASYVFDGCARLTTITIPNNIRVIGSYAFYNCSSLTSVVIGGSVESIDSSAFSSCSSLTSVEYKGSIDSWVEIEFGNSYSNPLYYAKKLIIDGKEVTEVNLTTSTKINAYAFYNCNTITSVVIPTSITSIGNYAFRACSLLTSVYYKGTAEDWAKITIGSSNSYLTNATRYYYSENTPTTSGNYWHYVDGVPTKW